MKKPASPSADVDGATQEIDRDQIAAAIQEIFRSPAGDIVLGWLSARFGFIRHSTHVPGDPGTSAVHEGQRSVLVEIGRLLESTPGETGGTETPEM